MSDSERQWRAHPSGAASSLLNTQQIAKRLNRAPRTVARWREVGYGPPFIKTPSGAILYPQDRFEAWLASHAVEGETAA